METEGVKSQAQIVSNTPGRLRMRMYQPKRQAELMHCLKADLKERSGIERIDINPTTGSVTIRYNIQIHSHDNVRDLLYDFGVILNDVVADTENEWLKVGHSKAATQISSAITELDHRVFRLSGGKVDLKLALPLSMGILGVRQILRDGLGISQIPGYVLLWYAFQAFYNLHQKPQKQTIE